MNIVTNTGDADAHLALPPASAASIVREIAAERFARYDRALKAHAAAWKRIKVLLRVTAPLPEPRQACGA